ncbi:MAG: hypothetical protein HQM16_04080 [Deltaproteobacteria bacterium]|nr:hypothetical protein [Deltaproteobacteria bacterium]
MKHRYTLPRTIDDGRIDYLLKVIHAAKTAGTGKLEIELEWSKTSAISPAGHALLSCLFDAMVEQRIHVVSKNVPQKISVLPVVANMMNIASFKSLPEPKANNFEDRTMLIRGSAGAIDGLLAERLNEIFSSKIPGDLLYSSLLIMNELMQNSADHSSSERYYAYAGLWNNEFHAGLLDMGVSIPAKLEQKYECQNDIGYLELAMEDGTSTRRQRTGGLGLHYFFDLLKENEGKLTILSRRAQIRRYFKTRRSQKGMLKYPLIGTWCFARFALHGGKK